jgi:hypothetical protein
LNIGHAGTVVDFQKDRRFSLAFCAHPAFYADRPLLDFDDKSSLMVGVMGFSNSSKKLLTIYLAEGRKSIERAFYPIN